MSAGDPPNLFVYVIYLAILHLIAYLLHTSHVEFLVEDVQ